MLSARLTKSLLVGGSRYDFEASVEQFSHGAYFILLLWKMNSRLRVLLHNGHDHDLDAVKRASVRNQAPDMRYMSKELMKALHLRGSCDLILTDEAGADMVKVLAELYFDGTLNSTNNRLLEC